MRKQSPYKTAVMCVGPEDYVGGIARLQEVEVHPGFTKREIKLIAIVTDKHGLPFESHDVARKYTKKALFKVRRGR